MPAPPLTPAPPAPLRSQNPAVFTSTAETFVDWWAGFPDELNAWADYWDTYTPSGGAESGPVGDSGLTMSTARVLGRTTASTGVIEELTAAQLRAFALLEQWNIVFTSAGDAYIAAGEAMTIDQGNAKIGTGTLTYEKSTTAAPATFSSTTLPATIQAGAWLKISASAITGFVAAHLKRTA